MKPFHYRQKLCSNLLLKPRGAEGERGGWWGNTGVRGNSAVGGVGGNSGGGGQQWGCLQPQEPPFTP